MGISGNAGLKDQQMALEWVYENISSFNGDPGNICLFGESAGAACVHYQVLNKKSRKFLKSAICQSGNGLGDWAIQTEGIALTRRLAKLMGCAGDDDRKIYKTLMSASTEEIYQFKTKPQNPDERRRNLVFTFKPTVELDSDDAFMSKSPRELIKDKSNQIDIPVIFGTNNMDGMVMAAASKHLLHNFDKDPVKLLPLSINVDPNSLEGSKLAEEIKRFYFGDKEICVETIQKFIDHMTDYHFFIPQTMVNELNARFQPLMKQFLYHFRCDSELNVYKKMLMMTDIPGAAHADDICYLFHQRSIDENIDINTKAWKMRQTMCKLWTNFAKYQDPTPDHDNPLTVKWKPVQADGNSNDIDLDYLVIDENPRVFRNICRERVNFWRRIYEKYNLEFTESAQYGTRIKPKL